MKRIATLVLTAALSIAAHADQETQDKVLKATQNVTMSIFSAYFDEAIARAKGYPAGGSENRLKGLETMALGVLRSGVDTKWSQLNRILDDDLMIDAADLPMSASCRSVSIAPCTHRSKSPFSTLIDAHSWNLRAASSAPEVSLGSHCDPATPSVIRPSITGTIAPRKFPNAVAEFSKIAEI